MSKHLSLSSADQKHLENTLQILLTPLDYAESAQWQTAVNDELKQLLGADQALFMLPAGDHVQLQTEEEVRSVAATYPAWNDELERGYGTTRRQVELGVWNRKRLWQPHLEAFYRSAYYNELIVPTRSYDAIGLSIPLEPVVNNQTVASVLLHHNTPHGARFGERGLALLRLIKPAFESGVRMVRYVEEERAHLERRIDASDKPLLVCKASGEVLHQNAALTRLLLKADLHGDHLLRRMREVALRLGDNPGTMEAAGGTPVEVVETPVGAFRIQISYVLSDMFGKEPSVVIALDPMTTEWPSEALLRERLGLTRQEARVALLLAQGATNAAIAEALFISPHTARRHTENILSKLNLHARAEVAACILSRCRP